MMMMIEIYLLAIKNVFITKVYLNFVSKTGEAVMTRKLWSWIMPLKGLCTACTSAQVDKNRQVRMKIILNIHLILCILVYLALL